MLFSASFAVLRTECDTQNIPNELKNKTTAQVILTFFTPPVGALIAAMVSTFGIYFAASFLYVRVFFVLCVPAVF